MDLLVKRIRDLTVKHTSPLNDPTFHVKVKTDEVKIHFYYIRTEEGFQVVDEKPAEGEYGTLEMWIETQGIRGGPAVSFREIGPHFQGELMDLPRKGSPASMDIRLPEGILVARDGIGDWTMSIPLSKRVLVANVG